MLYKEREIDELDNYIDHVSAMTKESLNSKSDIAAELAFRDQEIKRLNDELNKSNEWLDNALEALASVKESGGIMGEDIYRMIELGLDNKSQNELVI